MDTIIIQSNRNVSAEIVFGRVVKLHPLLTTRIFHNEISNEYQQATGASLTVDVPCEDLPAAEVLSDYIKDTTPVITVLESPLAIFRYVRKQQTTAYVIHIHRVISCFGNLKQIKDDLEHLLSGDIENEFQNRENETTCILDFVKAEKEYLQSSQFQSDDKFWRKMFSSPPSEATMSLNPHDEEENWNVHEANHIFCEFSREQSSLIANTIASTKGDTFAFFLACLTVVLQRYMGVSETVISVWVEEWKNHVLYRSRADQGKTFKEHIAEVSESWGEVFSHGKYPLLNVLDIMRDLHYSSITSICVIEFSINSCQSILSHRTRHARMPLFLEIEADDVKDPTKIHLQWAKDYIDDEVAKRFLDSFLNMCLCDNLEYDIKELEYLNHEELDWLRNFEGNAKTIQGPIIPIHGAFEEACAHHPEAVAMWYNGDKFSYSDINNIASSLASRLSDEVGEDTVQDRPIALFMEKDQYAVAAIFGVWKFGGYFLPLSTTHESTLRNLIEKDTISCVVHNVELSDEIKHLIFQSSCKTLDITTVTVSKQNHTVFARENTTLINGDRTAYAIRTSGSTGRPKLCKIAHKSLHILSEAWVDACGLFPGSTVLQWAPLSFDVFIGDLVRALITTRGTIVLCPDNRRLDVLYIHELFAKYQITHVEFTPQFALRVFETAPDEVLQSLICLVIGSDVTHQSLFRTIRSKLRPDQRFIHGYGMTEATIDSIYFEEENIPITRSGTVPIGKPLPGVKALVLDSTTMQRCPIGTIGELYLCGDVIATGDVTCVDVPGVIERALPTKDRCCWLPSGDLELFGRLDDVVKVRGFRVSLTEIENKILDSAHSVKEVNVQVLNEKEKEREYLCAFIVTNDDLKLDKQYICSMLEGKLPYYMLPDLVVSVPVIPLTANGKINRKALPTLQQILLDSTANVSTSASVLADDTSACLRGLFAIALGVNDKNTISLTETFMNQGGHSLILLAFHNLILRETDYKISMKDVLLHPTIESLACYIDSICA